MEMPFENEHPFSFASSFGGISPPYASSVFKCPKMAPLCHSIQSCNTQWHKHRGNANVRAHSLLSECHYCINLHGENQTQPRVSKTEAKGWKAQIRGTGNQSVLLLVYRLSSSRRGTKQQTRRSRQTRRVIECWVLCLWILPHLSRGFNMWLDGTTSWTSTVNARDKSKSPSPRRTSSM